MPHLGLVAVVTAATVASVVAQTRVPNTTLRVPLTPPSPPGYHFVTAFSPAVTFEYPVALVSPPGETDRLFVVEQPGRIMVITNLSAPNKTLFLDISANTRFSGEQGLLGLAFHPDYVNNGRFFVFRTCMALYNGSSWRHDRLSEFRVSQSDPNQADPAETILFQQLDTQGNHNAGDLHFGPDGYLYVAVGDEGGSNDLGANSQKITKDLFSGILRLDVDHRPESVDPNPHPAVMPGAYRIPADNPFVGATSFLGVPIDPTRVRAEFWSVGLRNPWRMSFDSLTGELWVGDVGQGKFESVFVTRAGANHGWAFQEGPVAGPKTNAPVDFLTNPSFNYVPPIYSYDHSVGPMGGYALIGGRVYRGSRFPSLYGKYVFADYGSGNVWTLKNAGSTPEVARITGQPGITAFGVDPRNQDILACTRGGNLWRLETDGPPIGDPIPPTLAETGAFSSFSKLKPNPGIVPYWVRLPFWSDDARKMRWFSIPSTNDFMTFVPDDTYITPPGTVWIKHFVIEMTKGDPSTERRLETRFLVRNHTGVHGFTYRWNSPNNAVLVPEEGQVEILNRVVNGQPVQQPWRYPSRVECLTCHNEAAGYSLTFNTSQLRRADNRTLTVMIESGYFSNPPTDAEVEQLRMVRVPTDEKVSVEYRSRSWLAVNCGYCHRPGGGGGGELDLRLHTATENTGMINGILNDTFGDPENRVIAPGDLVHSQLWQRMLTRGPNQMPAIATSIPDPDGVSVVRRWIESMPAPAARISPSFELAPNLEKSRDQGLRLRVLQPANRAVRIETASSLDSAHWEAVHFSEMHEASFLSEPHEIEVEVPAGESQFFRVETESP